VLNDNWYIAAHERVTQHVRQLMTCCAEEDESLSASKKVKKGKKKSKAKKKGVAKKKAANKEEAEPRLSDSASCQDLCTMREVMKSLLQPDAGKFAALCCQFCFNDVM
jgi:hypothetical protein